MCKAGTYRDELMLLESNDEWCFNCEKMHNPLVDCHPNMRPIDFVAIEKMLYAHELEKFRRIFE